MYVILVNENNSLSTTQKQRIIQRSKLVDDLWFLVNSTYNGHDLTNSTVLLEYLKPVSKEYKTEILTLSEERYKENYLKYTLPIDTEFTEEAGSLELQLSFIYTEVDTAGNLTQHIRKTSPAIKVDILPISAWSDIIPDSALTAIDQRIIKQDAQIKAIEELLAMANGGLANEYDLVDNLKYDFEEDALQLMSGDKQVGGKVYIKNMFEDGVPVVDFGSVATPPSIPDTEEDNVVEF